MAFIHTVRRQHVFIAMVDQPEARKALSLPVALELETILERLAVFDKGRAVVWRGR